MRFTALCFAGAASMIYLVGMNTCADADTLRTFAMSGLLRSGAVLSGTLTIDEDAGVVVSCDVRVAGTKTLTFERVAKQAVVGLAAVVVLAPADRNWPRLVFGERTFPGSLRGYMGGPLGRRTDIVRRDGSQEVILTGQLVAVATASP